MNQNEIIAMAKEAGISLEIMVLLCGVEIQVTASPLSVDELARFAALAAEKASAKEREACQKIADDCADADMHASMAANAIRARGQKEAA